MQNAELCPQISTFVWKSRLLLGLLIFCWFFS